ncbi:hypothetical protein HZA86_03700 [Candidatus Uhrbacteria bacterium]|nr:hypothetical protein [Candidatus Uhrbacteria bacterium]
MKPSEGSVLRFDRVGGQGVCYPTLANLDYQHTLAIGEEEGVSVWTSEKVMIPITFCTGRFQIKGRDGEWLVRWESSPFGEQINPTGTGAVIYPDGWAAVGWLEKDIISAVKAEGLTPAVRHPYRLLKR